MCTCARPSEGLGGAALEDGVLQVVSKPTLAIARTGQCASIWRMARGACGPGWDTAWHMAPALNVLACAKRVRSWTFARVGELDRRECRVLWGG